MTPAARAGRKLVAHPDPVNQLSQRSELYFKNSVLGHFFGEIFAPESG